jgi:hypothetical protein
MSDVIVIDIITHVIATMLGGISALIATHGSQWIGCRVGNHDWLYLVGRSLQATKAAEAGASRVCARCGYVDDVGLRTEEARIRILAARNGAQAEPGALSEVRR